MDAVDRILAEWAQQRPDLDVTPMAVVGRLHRVGALLDAELRALFAEHGLDAGEFDVLASLRRAGAPFERTPGALRAAMMVTSGAVSKRVDRLEAAALVTRSVAAADARSRLVRLTAEGLALADRVVDRHVANEDRLLAALSTEQRAQLADLLSRVLVDLDPPAPASAPTGRGARERAP